MLLGVLFEIVHNMKNISYGVWLSELIILWIGGIDEDYSQYMTGMYFSDFLDF